jgi:hypothetical protein
MSERYAARLTPDHRAESPYLAVPFDVDGGATSVEVRLAFDRSVAVIDLGCEGAAGWRGWSGGARDTFVIGPETATPGYLPGPLEPGTWSVILGLHRIPRDGVDVAVTVSTPAAAPAAAEPAAPPVPARRTRRSLPAPDGLTWWACDFHAHTVHSDGSLGIAELAALAVDAGLDVLAVTDHNTTSHHPHLQAIGDRYGITLLPGQEVTTDRGHANAFGPIPWVDFRRPAQEWVEQVERDGGILSINHPLGADCAWHQPLSTRPRHAELWHSGWFDRTWSAPMAWSSAWRPDVIPLGGSDFHSPEGGHPLAAPVTWVAAATPSVSDIMAGIRAGRTAISAGYDAPVLLRVDDELIALGADGSVLIDTAGQRHVVHGDRVTFPATALGHRLEGHRNEVIGMTA